MREPHPKPSLFIKGPTEYLPEDYPGDLGPPDLVVYCETELTYEEYLATVLAQKKLGLRHLPED